MLFTFPTIVVPTRCFSCYKVGVLQPCAKQELDILEEQLIPVKPQCILWFCKECFYHMNHSVWQKVLIQYAHAIYRPGLHVQIAPRIIELLPHYSLGGAIGTTSMGYYSPLEDAEAQVSWRTNPMSYRHEKLVPICLDGYPIPRHVPQEYVLID